MADKIDKSIIEEHLKCPVCHGTLEDARLLECGHSYCKTCIGTVIDSTHRHGGEMECPYCRQKVSIQSGSDGLKQNWIANNILQVLANSEEDEPVPEEEAEETCEIHPGNDEDYYCEKCSVVVCSHCAISDHIHFDLETGVTRPKTVEEVVPIIRERFRGLLERADVWSAQHVVYEDTIVDIKRVGSQALEMVERDVLQEYDARLEQLNQSRDKLLDHITTVKVSFCGRMEKLLLTEREYITDVKQCHILTNLIIDTWTDKKVVVFDKEWSQEFNRNLSHDVPCTDDAESDLKIVRALYFEKSPVPSDSLYLDIGFIGNYPKIDEFQSSPASHDEGGNSEDMPELEDVDHAYLDFQVAANQSIKESRRNQTEEPCDNLVEPTKELKQEDGDWTDTMSELGLDILFGQ